ncbi:MAG: DUF4105 domain-containing protein [Gemmatimonadales bacterium]
MRGFCPPARFRVWSRAFLLCTGLLLPAVARGQTPAAAAEPGSELTVYLMTMGVGHYVWERFGHNAIGIRDASTGLDVAYNYGVFSFQQENFLWRFIQGRMRYWVAGEDAGAMVARYIRDNRSVWIQELNLTPAERLEIKRFLEWNAREENKYYRYDYYRDNCSTRVRDVLDRVLGGRIRARTDTAAAGTTFRWETLRLTANSLPIYTGLLIAEGPAVDRPISVWEEMFLPLALREEMRKITVIGADGTERPLVSRERTLFESDVPVPSAPPRWAGWFLLVGLGVGALMAWLGRARRASRAARAGFVSLGMVWGLVTGLGGLIMLFLWAVTDHAIAYRNENLLQFNPLALGLLVLLPLAAAGRRLPAARKLALVLLVCSAAGLLLRLIPGLVQANLSVILMVLPIQAGILGGLRAEG